jgi:hypothetical protein
MTAATFSSASRGMAGASTSSMSTPANYRVDASGLSNILSRELRSGLRRISIRAKICIPIRVPGGGTLDWKPRRRASARGFLALRPSAHWGTRVRRELLGWSDCLTRGRHVDGSDTLEDERTVVKS